MECFNCRSAMTIIQSHGVTVDHCYACGAYWFDRGQMSALLAGEGLTLPEPTGQRWRAPNVCRWCERTYPAGETWCEGCDRPLGYSCPRDGAALVIVEERGLELDWCRSCGGIWFDGREFMALLEALRAGRMQVAEDESVSIDPNGGLGRCQSCGAEVGEDGLQLVENLWCCASCKRQTSRDASSSPRVAVEERAGSRELSRWGVRSASAVDPAAADEPSDDSAPMEGLVRFFDE